MTIKKNINAIKGLGLKIREAAKTQYELDAGNLALRSPYVVRGHKPTLDALLEVRADQVRRDDPNADLSDHNA